MKRVFLLTLFILLPWVTLADIPKERQLASAIVDAKTPATKGLAIAEMVDLRDTGWGDYEANMIIISRNRQGQESKYNVRVRGMEIAGDGDRGMLIFDTPRNVKGAVTLTWSHALKPDSQWIFLPVLKRVKRIASSRKSGSFMGSEFAYEDFSSPEVEKYTYKYQRDEVYHEMDCYVVERYPAYDDSGYARQVTWFDKKNFNPQQIIYYDRKNAQLKTLIFSGYRQYLGKYWRADEMLMTNHQTGKSTRLVWEKYQFRQGFTNRDFDKAIMKTVE